MTRKQRKEQVERRLLRKATAERFVAELRKSTIVLPDCMLPEDAVWVMHQSFIEDIKKAATKTGVSYTAYKIGPYKLKPGVKVIKQEGV